MSLRRSTRYALFFWLLLPTLSWAQSDLLRGTVDALRGQERVAVDGDWLLSGRLLAALYDAVGYEPAWSRPEQVQALLVAIDDAEMEGLRPSELHRGTVEAFSDPAALDDLTPAARIAAELRLSDALLRFLIQMRYGRLDPAVVNRAWNHRPAIAVRPLIESAKTVLSAQDTSTVLSAVIPRPYFYRNLLHALAQYTATEQLGDLPAIPGGRNLSLGSRNERVGLIRERLALIGESPQDTPESLETFDQGLRKSVIAFQQRFGLLADGIVGPATLAALNRPYDPSNLEKIRINLERMRWFYAALPQDYVLVDVGGFMAHVIRGRDVAWSTRVVVGTPKNQTPSFRDEMEHVVFNPTWTVPESIEKSFRGVPSGYKRVRMGGKYYLVQQPGPRNALGRVKFMFPNGQAVYMHDTPSKHLFSRRTRTYSHGCVRVKDPLKLAEVILNRPSWDQSAIKRVVRRGSTRYVNLDEHLPVIIYYLTAVADDDGQVQLRRDVYGRDAALKRAFAGPAHPPRLRFPDPEPIPDPPSTPAADPAVIPAADDASEPAAPVRAPSTPLPGTTLTAEPPASSPRSPVAEETPADAIADISEPASVSTVRALASD